MRYIGLFSLTGKPIGLLRYDGALAETMIHDGSWQPTDSAPFRILPERAVELDDDEARMVAFILDVPEAVPVAA